MNTKEVMQWFNDFRVKANKAFLDFTNWLFSKSTMTNIPPLVNIFFRVLIPITFFWAITFDYDQLAFFSFFVYFFYAIYYGPRSHILIEIGNKDYILIEFGNKDKDNQP